MKAVLQYLGAIGKILLLDIGTNFIPGLDDILDVCNEIVLVTEPQPVTIQRTQHPAGRIEPKGIWEIQAAFPGFDQPDADRRAIFDLAGTGCAAYPGSANGPPSSRIGIPGKLAEYSSN